MENLYYNIAEEKFNKFLLEQNEINLSRELQKIRLIPLDMFGAKAAINNIIDAEITRNTIDFNKTIPSLMSLDLSNVSVRSKFRFDDYYKRFFKSRNRGFDFEGMIAGFLDSTISEDINSPFDITTSGNKISLKTLNDKSESVVIKSIAKNVTNYIKNYRGSEENRQTAINALMSNNPVKYLLDSNNQDLINIAEDLVNETLSGIDSLLIGIPRSDNKIDL